MSEYTTHCLYGNALFYYEFRIRHRASYLHHSPRLLYFEWIGITNFAPALEKPPLPTLSADDPPFPPRYARKGCQSCSAGHLILHFCATSLRCKRTSFLRSKTSFAVRQHRSRSDLLLRRAPQRRHSRQFTAMKSPIHEANASIHGDGCHQFTRRRRNSFRIPA